MHAPPISLLWLVISCFLFKGPNTYAQGVEIKGIYGSPVPFWERGIQLKDLGVNAVFVHSGSINDKMVTRLKQQGIQLYAEFATLNGKNYVEDHPEAWAINEKGEQVAAASWFMGVCPTEPGFRKYRFEQLRKLLATYSLDGIWMDYVHWHAQFEDPEPILPETCFCDRCLKTFSDYSGIPVEGSSTKDKAQKILNSHEAAWRDWRCQVILEWAIEIKSILNQSKPEALLGLYHCPWEDNAFEGARRRILGLDFELLSEVVDVFSPMVYHGRMGRDPQWVQENIEWLSERLTHVNNQHPKIWPIVQAHNDPEVISASEFETVLRGGVSGKATGIMMFTSYSVADDSLKTAIMKNVYRSWQTGK